MDLCQQIISQRSIGLRFRPRVVADDYVVFGLTIASGTQANLVGINNLYTEATPKCNGGTPFVTFAYNTVTHAAGRSGPRRRFLLMARRLHSWKARTADPIFMCWCCQLRFPALRHLQSELFGLRKVLQVAQIRQRPIACPPPLFLAVPTQRRHHGSTTTQTLRTLGPTMANFTRFRPVFGGGTPTVVSDTNWPVTVWTSGYQQSSDRSDCR